MLDSWMCAYGAPTSYGDSLNDFDNLFPATQLRHDYWKQLRKPIE